MSTAVTINSIAQLSSLQKKTNIDLTQATRVPLWLIQSPQQKKTSKIINYLFVTKATLLLAYLFFTFYLFRFVIKYISTTPHILQVFSLVSASQKFVFFYTNIDTANTFEERIINSFYANALYTVHVIIPFIRCLRCKENKQMHCKQWFARHCIVGKDINLNMKINSVMVGWGSD